MILSFEAGRPMSGFSSAAKHLRRLAGCSSFAQPDGLGAMVLRPG